MTSTVPEPMIGLPLSASVLRIANWMSCLRSVEAFSTPQLLGHGDQFGGGFALQIVKMHVSL